MTHVTVKGYGGITFADGVRRSRFTAGTPMDSRTSQTSGRRPGRPRADEADDVRGKLKESAHRCFGLYGYEGASVARIAKGAGVASLNGMMLDMPHLKLAERVLSRVK